MQPRLANLLAEITAALEAMDDVFSAAQWGGRAYKLPGPGGNRRKPKLLAFVSPTRDERAITVSLKLPKPRAEALIAKHDWIARHSFRTLGSSGWIEATVTRKRQLAPLTRLIEESRQLYPIRSRPEAEIEITPGATNPVARRIERVMREARADGLSPPPEDAYDF